MTPTMATSSRIERISKGRSQWLKSASPSLAVSPSTRRDWTAEAAGLALTKVLTRMPAMAATAS